MGFVVNSFMLMGLLLLWPWPSSLARWLQTRPTTARAIAIGILLAGAWNTLWYGLRHLDAFWGIAALVSGVLMMATAAVVLRRNRRHTVTSNAMSDEAPATGNRHPLALSLFAALLACFLLYAVTLVRLNLGLPIIDP